MSNQQSFKAHTEQVAKLFRKANAREKTMIGEMHLYYEKQFRDMPADSQREGIAAGIHDAVDRHVEEVKRTPNGQRIQCRKGCSACCHMLVSITPDEAKLLLMFAHDQGIEINRDRLKQQAAACDLDDWDALPHEIRACGFLADDGACSVYEHRPTACRKHFVRSSPADCDLRGKAKQVAMVVSPEAEVIASAALGVFGFGQMARMLLDAAQDEEPH